MEVLKFLQEMIKMRQIELLAPVGGWESLEAAVQNGADAVYLGGKLLNARQYANNFDPEELEKAVRYCHVRGVKVFVTVNTLVANEEFMRLGNYLAFLYNIDVDAIIVQDLGVMKLVRDLFPDFAIHGSTQMFIHNLEGAKFLEKLGFKRVVLAREMSEKEIIDVQKSTNIDIEVFVHGALCVCYSGQCLMSSMIGGRSGNRGRCAQPCRMKYSLIDQDKKEKIKNPLGDYLLSTKDLNTLENLNEILDIGVASLKIEGRMKRPEYVAIVVEAYRKAIDHYQLYKNNPKIHPKTLKDVEQIFNRKFTKGYLLGDSGSAIMSFAKPSNRGVKIGKVMAYDQHKKRVQIKLEGHLSKGDAIQIWTTKGDQTGGVVENIFFKGQKKLSAGNHDIIEIPFREHVAQNSLVYKISDIELLKRAKETYAKQKKRISLYGKFTGRLGEKIRLSLWDDDEHFVYQEGEYIVEKAFKKPIEKERIREQIEKLGNTPYEMIKLEIEWYEEGMIPIRELNRLRRRAVEKLSGMRAIYNDREPVGLAQFDKKLKRWFHRNIEKSHGDMKNQKNEIHIRVEVSNIQQLKAALNFNMDRIYYSDFDTIEEALEIVQGHNIELIPVSFRVIGDEELTYFKRKVDRFKNINGIMVSDLGALNAIKDIKAMNIYTDFSLNIFNNKALQFLYEEKVKGVTLSPELTLKQIRNIMEEAPLPCEVIIHGYLPLMVTKYCPINAIAGDIHQKNCNACRNKAFGLEDRLGMIFPIITDKHCRVQLLNAQKLCLIEHIKELVDAGVTCMRIRFTIEKSNEVIDTLNAYMEAVKNCNQENWNQNPRIQDFIKQWKTEGITKGHYFRGIQ